MSGIQIELARLGLFLCPVLAALALKERDLEGAIAATAAAGVFLVMIWGIT